MFTGRDYFRELITDSTRGEFRTQVTEPYVPAGLARLNAALVADLEMKFGADAHLLIVSDGGQIVSDLRYSQAARAYGDAYAEFTKEVYLDALDPDCVFAINAALASSDMVAAALHGEGHFLMAFKIEGMPLSAVLATSRSTMLASSRNMGIVAVILSAIMTVVMLAGIYVATRSMLVSLVNMDGAMRGIATDWDLAAQVAVRGNDEIAAIGESVNQFVGSINEMIGSASESAGKMDAVGATLSEDAAEISGDVSSINREIDSLRFAAEEQSASVAETSATIAQIAQHIESLARQIEGQSAAVSESSAAVQQMVANIASIPQNLSKAAGNFDELKGTAAGGRESISAAEELVSKLSACRDYQLNSP